MQTTFSDDQSRQEHIPDSGVPEASLPEPGTRCTEVLSDTLEGYAGIQQANFDIESGKLNIQFDPRVLSREQAVRLVHESGKQASLRVLQCRSRGPQACAACVGEMGDTLVKHYRRIGEMPVPAIRFQPGTQTGAIEVNLNHASLLSAESMSVENITRDRPVTLPEQPTGLPREKAEIILTVFNAVFGLSAFAASQLLPQANLAWILWGLSYLSGGYYGLMDGIGALKEKRLDVNLLMILAALGAAAIGSPAEGAILLFLFSLSNTLQSFAMGRSRKAIEKLLDLRPPTANVRRGSRV